MASTKRVAVDRKALREHYARYPTNGITFYYPWAECDGGWMLSTPGHTRLISERAALVRLGHLKPQHGFVPSDVVGTGTAVIPGTKETA